MFNCMVNCTFECDIDVVAHKDVLHFIDETAISSEFRLYFRECPFLVCDYI